MERIETPRECAQRFDPCARGEFVGLDEAEKIITARDAAIRAEANKIECERDHLVEAAKRYMKAYGPGYSTTDTLAYDALTGVLNAICRKEVVG